MGASCSVVLNLELLSQLVLAEPLWLASFTITRTSILVRQPWEHMDSVFAEYCAQACTPCLHIVLIVGCTSAAQILGLFL